MNREWFYFKNKKGYGPVSWERILELYQGNKLTDNSKVWSYNFSNWVELSEVIKNRESKYKSISPPRPSQKAEPPPIPETSKSPPPLSRKEEKDIKVGPIQSKEDFIASKLLTKVSFVVLSLLLMASLYTLITGGFNNDTNKEVDELTQSVSKEKFRKILSSTFRTKFNVIQLPADFYDCAYQEFKKIDDANFDTGYLMGKQCMPKYIDQIKYSDNGIRMLKFFDAIYVNKCTEKISQFEEYISSTSRYCKCLHEQFVKYKVGMEKISDPEFQKSMLNEKITNYCFSINKK